MNLYYFDISGKEAKFLFDKLYHFFPCSTINTITHIFNDWTGDPFCATLEFHQILSLRHLFFATHTFSFLATGFMLDSYYLYHFGFLSLWLACQSKDFLTAETFGWTLSRSWNLLRIHDLTAGTFIFRRMSWQYSRILSLKEKASPHIKAQRREISFL